MKGSSVSGYLLLLIYCFLFFLVVAGCVVRDYLGSPNDALYRSLLNTRICVKNMTTTKAEVRPKGLWDYLTKGSNETSDKVVLFSTNIWGGFGNSFRGLRGLSIYALLKDAKIRVVWDDYFMVMDDALQDLQLKSWESLPYCKYLGCIEDARFLDTDFECLRVSAYLDFSDTLLESEESLNRFVELGLFPSTPTAQDVKEMVTRQLFQLKPSLLADLSPTLEEIRKHDVVGFQFRTGGNVANYEEDTVFINMNRLGSVFDVLRNVSRQSRFHRPYLFLSTDSTKIVELFRREKKYYLITYDKYPIGHSSRVRDGTDSTLFRAVSDIYLLSQCNTLITTYTSSFGDLANMLSHAKTKVII